MKIVDFFFKKQFSYQPILVNINADSDISVIPVDNISKQIY